jgi:hypothetical protein
MVGVFEADSTARPSRATRSYDDGGTFRAKSPRLDGRLCRSRSCLSAVERSHLQRSKEGGALVLGEMVDHHLFVGR